MTPKRRKVSKKPRRQSSKSSKIMNCFQTDLFQKGVNYYAEQQSTLGEHSGSRCDRNSCSIWTDAGIGCNGNRSCSTKRNNSCDQKKPPISRLRKSSCRLRQKMRSWSKCALKPRMRGKTQGLYYVKKE